MLVRHAPCPRCTKNGRDTRGDNLAIYENGEHCFACEYGRPYDKKIEPTNKSLDVFAYELSEHLPSEWEEWLDQYQLSRSLVQKHIRYCADLDRLTIHVDQYIEARSLTKEPKVRSWGQKPTYIFPHWPEAKHPLIFVEDVISAMVVGKSFCTAPLFGSQWLDNWTPHIIKYKYIPIFWLDKDKFDKAKEYRDMWLAQGIPSTLIFTPKDPKYYYNYQIKEFVYKARKKLNLPEEKELDTVCRWNPIMSRMEFVPKGSARAKWWMPSVPDFISTTTVENLPPGQAIRFLTDTPVYAAPNTHEWYLPCSPSHSMLHTRLNNTELHYEEGKLDHEAKVNYTIQAGPVLYGLDGPDPAPQPGGIKYYSQQSWESLVNKPIKKASAANTGQHKQYLYKILKDDTTT